MAQMTTNAAIERWYPLAGGATVALAFLFVSPQAFPVQADAAPSLFSAVISLAAIAVGFLATAKSILIAIENGIAVRQLKSVGLYETLVSYLVTATRWGFVLSVASILCFVIDLRQPAGWHRFALTLWLFSLVTAGLTFYRVFEIFARVLRL